jgi:hypothetical protein
VVLEAEWRTIPNTAVANLTMLNKGLVRYILVINLLYIIVLAATISLIIFNLIRHPQYQIKQMGRIVMFSSRT